MPIYSYRCTSCGNQQDILQKISDAPLGTCPVCSAATFSKQVTAAGFQLKGSGWYVTDFRNPAAKTAASKSDQPDPQAGSSTDGAPDKAAGAATDTNAAKPAQAVADSGVATPSKAPASPAPTSGSSSSVAK